NAPEPIRLAAVRLFGRGFNSPENDLPQLAPFIGPGASAEFQKAGLDTLARSGSPHVPGIALRDWAQQGPSMRISIIDLLLSRDEWTRSLLDAIESGGVAAADVPAASRQRLAKHADESIRKRAETLVPVNRATDRSAVVAKYQVVNDLRGDGVKGAAIFMNTCSPCHSYLGHGHDVGPNVMTYRSKGVQDFLVAILDPNAVVEPRFAAYNVQTRDGRALYGVISSETATTLVLAQPGGLRETILRSDIASLHAANLSLMPEGLEQALSPQDLADLIAYLKGGG
ncbi:MAG TPA: c-type cytochrome, partial [Chthoniobacteraceae bacterium]|nr:c-type cytochrome [Chthoniobacteraceae bacterium]